MIGWFWKVKYLGVVGEYFFGYGIKFLINWFNELEKDKVFGIENNVCIGGDVGFWYGGLRLLKCIDFGFRVGIK